MESSLRGHAATFQQQQQVQMQNQQYMQQQQHRRRNYGGGNSHSQAQDYMSVGSHFSRESVASTTSGASSQVDEAYRRLGRRLSARAHGDGPIKQPQRLSRIGLTPASTFTPYHSKNATLKMNNATNKETNDGSSGSSDRTPKVAKTGYLDHGDHHHHKTPSRKGNVARKMTINAADLFRLWQADVASTSRKSKKRSSPVENGQRSNKSEKGVVPPTTDLSPHRFAFSQLALEGSGVPQPTTGNPQLKGATIESTTQLHSNLLGDGMHHSGIGLTAVIENSSQTSSQSNTPTSRHEDSSLASKSTNASNIVRSLPRGKCLTQPSEPTANSGLDNVEGNLIVFENDAISISRKQIHVLSKDKMNVNRADFRIQSLLGQGTFAQVFQCVHVQTGNLVAIKIVKNKPAYTRQAAVEIDVFRALVKGHPDKPLHSSSQSQKLSSSPTGNSVADLSVASNAGGGKQFDHMVDLVCYFMHQNHLCLVFELLGLNLYEVLKKRQFRGLPLSVVRTLVKQGVFSVKELAKKNIVHCDLKPENILLVHEDDVDSVVSAGESRRLSSSSRTGTSPHKQRIQYSTSTFSEKKQSMGDPPLTASGMDKITCGNPSSMTVPTEAMSQSPANSLGTNATTITAGHSLAGQKIKLIDFGSACFEGQTAHTYIQSRFYRSPEVLVGLPYDSAIDMWSLGCVAAELFLGLPILPGVHEHDQLCRICEMISKPSDWMLEQGSKSSKYFVKFVPRAASASPMTDAPSGHSNPKMLPQWRIRTQQEYIASLSEAEIRKKGGLAKLEKQPANRYFKRKKLYEIITHKGQSGSPEEKDALDLFVHFLYGILDPDPWKRWTAAQAAQHPFLVGGPITRNRDRPPTTQVNKDENQANILCEIYWEAPWDPNICRRKLLNVQKVREKQQVSRRGFNNRNIPPRPSSSNSHDTSMKTVESSSALSQSPPKHTGPSREQQYGLGAILAHQGVGGQLSASYTDYANVQAGRVGNESDSVVSGQNGYLSGPLSYTEAGYQSSFLQNSFNEVDFAYALRRPGVVPMGDSVSSSVDLSAAGLTQQQQQHLLESYGGNSRGHLRSAQQQRRVPNSMPSRSFGEMGDPTVDRGNTHMFAPGSLGTAPGALSQQMPSSLQMGLSMAQQSPSTLNYQPAPSLGQNLAYGNQGIFLGGTSADSFGQQGFVMQSLEDPMMQHQQDPNLMANSLQQQMAQVYLQQQHAALQQQQFLLQQQQAALALQQQQLQAYGLSPANHQLNAMNQYSQPNGGYYYMTAADGTPMMVPTSGLAQPGAYGLTQQPSGYEGTSFNAQHGAIDPRYFQQDPNQY